MRAVAGLALLWLLGASGVLRAEEAPPPSPGTVETVLYLLGDAGDPDPTVLDALSRDAVHAGEQGVVVFLGDNIYPKGLVPEGDPERCEAERRLDAQIDAMANIGVRAIFLPGNHDWARGGVDGWRAVRRQEKHIEARATRPYVAPTCGVSSRNPLSFATTLATTFAPPPPAPAAPARTSDLFKPNPCWSAELLPRGGCPGPTVVDAGPHLRLVLLDTQWWLQKGPRPLHPGSSCPYDSPNEIADALRLAIAGAEGRNVAVLAHHPLATGGPHGGAFTVRDHLFPLTRKLPWLYLPLPLLGSIYPTARRFGVSEQDLSGKANVAMRLELSKALSRTPPLLFASGHEHGLQVLDCVSQTPAYRYHLVSGAGSLGELSPVSEIPGTLFAAARAGFMRLEVTNLGAVRLTVLAVSPTGQTTDVFSRWIK